MSNDGDPKRPARRPIRPDPRADDGDSSAHVEPPVRSIPLRRPLIAPPTSASTRSNGDDERRARTSDAPRSSRRDPRADDADEAPPRSLLRRPLGAADATIDRPRPEPAIAPRTMPEPAIAPRTMPEPVVARATKPLRVDELDDMSRSFTAPPSLRGAVLPAPAAPSRSAPIVTEKSAPTAPPSLDDEDVPPSRNDPRTHFDPPKKQADPEPPKIATVAAKQVDAPAPAPQRLFESLPAVAAVDAPIVDRDAPDLDAFASQPSAPTPVATNPVATNPVATNPVASPPPVATKPIAKPPSAAERSGDRTEGQRLAEALARITELTAKLEEAEKRYATLLIATRGDKDRVLTPEEQKRAASASAAMSELSMLTTPTAPSRPTSTKWVFPLTMLLFAGLALQGNRKPIAKSIAYLRNLPSNTQAKTTTMSIAHFVQIESALGRLPRPAKFTEWLKRHAETKSPSAWTDPWGKEYRLDARPLPLAIRSAGPDGVFETEDDLTAPIY